MFLAGLQLTVFPLRTADWFAWTIDVPMTAVFLGAAYWSSAVLEVAGARSVGWGRARLTVWTGARLHLADARRDAGPPRQVPPRPRASRPAPGSSRGAGWRSTPVCRSRCWSRSPSRRRRGLPAPRSALRRCRPGCAALLVVLAVVLLSGGVALLARAGLGVRGLALAAHRPHCPCHRGVARRARLGGRARPPHRRRRPGAAARADGVVFVVLEAVALLRYGDALDWSGRPAVVFVLVLGGIGAAGAWILLLGRAGRRTGQGLRAADAAARGRTR